MLISKPSHREKPTMLFVSLPLCATSPTMPMSYIYLAAWLEKIGISAEILDVKSISRPGGKLLFNSQKTLEKILLEIEVRKPRYIGFTCFTSDFNAVIKIGRLIKEKVNAKIIVGGIHPTMKPEDFFHEGSPVDIAVIGEGELTLSEFITRDLAGHKTDDVPGIMCRRNGEIIKTGERSYMHNLSTLPLPAYHKIDMDFYTIPQQSLVRYLRRGDALISAPSVPVGLEL